VIGLDDLPIDLAMNEVAPGRGEGEVPLTLKEARDRFEQADVLRAPEREDWNQRRPARGLGMHRVVFQDHATRVFRNIPPPRRFSSRLLTVSAPA
jgi:hypothetical protein